MGKRIKQDTELQSKYRGMKVSGQRIDVHRHIMEVFLGRKLTRNEIVHHKDGNPLNNDISNLELLSRSEHSRYHMTGRTISDNTRKKAGILSKERWKRGQCDTLKFSVQSFNKTTGQLLKTYESMTAAQIDGHDPRSISKCCRGLLKTYHGLLWKRA